MQFDIYFCIPSYLRADRQKTLELLERIGVPKEQIVLAVQTESDKEAYTKAGIADRVGTFLYREGHCVADNGKDHSIWPEYVQKRHVYAKGIPPQKTLRYRVLRDGCWRVAI